MRPMMTAVALWAATASLASLGALPAFAESPFAGKTGALSFAVDSAKSQLTFLSDAPMEKIRGTGEGVTGDFKVGEAADASTTTGRISVPVARLKTGNEMRDSHLKSPDWLNAGANPNITFEIERAALTKVEGNRASGTAHGKFSLNGKSVSKDIAIEIVYAGDRNALKVTAKFNVSLKDHDIKGKAGVVGSKVGESVEIMATLYATGK